ncbi:PIR Superfamily Protein [Plasmodium ovale wallikeri]|uniref:PIR Superfamily Protein n=1 Tax=Plasmodium ovale wallikeri TaxID=864142 RepID=A0A1A9ALP2_PLAOA|nr:PIR Superfamily Protein [Plasmodium ovale wallikeri]SBT59231.1 PIR Superfamily Protein [Plasmodium ovale wallikeri]
MGDDDDEDVFVDYDSGGVKYVTGSNYYPYLSSFVQYQQNFNQIINGSGGDTSYETRCSQIGNDRFQGSENFRKRCYEVAKYLNYIKSKESDGDTHERCAHLNYILNSNKDYYDIPNYGKKDLIKAYADVSPNLTYMCHSKIDLIDHNVLEKLTEIYNMHDLFNKVKSNKASCSGTSCSNITRCVSIYEKYIENCYVDSMDYICQELSKLKHAYDEHMETVTTCPEAVKILIPPKENNTGVTILIPCIIILIIPFFLFILYKFTPFGPLVRPRIQQIKRLLNNIYEEGQYKTVDKSEFIEQTEKSGSYQISYNSS